MKQAFNTRILVIDDEETIRDSFREILLPRKRKSESLEQAGAELFEEELPVQRSGMAFDFELEEAATGQQGLAQVQKALAENRPFAAIFVDMRMPGWDGLKTVQHIRKLDERAEIIFVTAYSDYTIEDIVEKAGTNVSYHCKPFSVEEIRQIGTKAVYEWNKTRNLEELIEVIAHLRTRQWQLEPLLNNILHQVSAMVGTVSAMLVKPGSSGRYEKAAAIGTLADDTLAQTYLNMIPGLIDKNIWQGEQFAYFKIEKYGILAVFESGEKVVLHQERLYIIRLFLEQAAQAIVNVEMHESLLRQEKLSAIGQAVSMIIHDLRGPISSIYQGIELAEEMADHREFVADMHRLMMNEAKRTLNMVNDILDFIRNSPLMKSPVDLKPFIELVQKDADGLLQDTNVRLSVELSKPFYFQADQSKMQRVLINLIKNAAEVLKHHNIAQPSIKLSAETAPGGVYFRVEDNGPGIPDQIRENLFIPFVTHNKKGGTGLGLAIVRQFVEAHGGKISVDTSAKGTNFSIFLPDE